MRASAASDSQSPDWHARIFTDRTAGVHAAGLKTVLRHVPREGDGIMIVLAGFLGVQLTALTLLLAAHKLACR
ncbi:MAG: hypothetical protein V4636_08800 [Pseudomonadota bacterium]